MNSKHTFICAYKHIHIHIYIYCICMYICIYTYGEPGMTTAALLVCRPALVVSTAHDSAQTAWSVPHHKAFHTKAYDRFYKRSVAGEDR